MTLLKFINSSKDHFFFTSKTDPNEKETELEKVDGN